MHAKKYVIIALILFFPMSVSANSSNEITFTFTNISWKNTSNPNNTNQTSFEFDFTLGAYNPSANELNLSYDAQVHPFSVSITYLGSYNISQLFKIDMPLCCLTQTFQPGSTKFSDTEWISVHNYNLPTLPTGTYIFSIENPSTLVGPLYNFTPVLYNSTLIISQGKTTIFYNSTVSSVNQQLKTNSLYLFDPLSLSLVIIVLAIYSKKRRQ